ncbi:myocyte-specific enhancer factor 2a, putative [Schistosoma mansoni]|uniref:myocyte-specific enhancer factor 2a, putative n=1 Tax=Schistosoma mansoni TaxID=6183 RepID=UPI00022C847B|nr:myocyte-specific enhancer factor 2a, putative [Schistosoma mansoni]|eukprot:XP_018646122.1 myocyte-specific enhancer factor 2a, putative [Schistosoma mansoni]
MGRKKIEIKFIKDEKNRLVTFAKRKSGLFKKAYELSVLCECEIALLVFTRSNRLYQYASVTVEHALQRLKKHHRANEFLSNSDMERLTNRRMRSNCNDGSGVIPSQPCSNMRSEENENDGGVDEDDEDDDDENDVDQSPIANIKNINNNNGCDQICQPTDDDKQKFDQIDIQSNVRFVVEPQSTFGIHPRNSINTVTETHMRPVSSMSLPPNSLISSINSVENEYLPHIQPVLVSHISSATKPNSPSNSQLIHYPRSSHQPSLCSSSVAPFTCNNSVINSKAIFTNLPKSTSHPPDHVNNILVSKQSSMPYIIQHSSNNQITLPVDCANLNDTHLVDNNTYMNTSLNHSFPHTTVINSNTSENFSPINNTGQMQCTLLTPTPYTQDLKVDQPLFILSSVVSNNHSNQNVLNTNLTSSVNMEPELAFKLGPPDLPHLSNRHDYSDSCEQHEQIDDYRNGVYENLVNHFTTNSITNLDKPIITATTDSPLTTPVPPNKHYVISQQCINSNYNLSSESMVIIQKIDTPTQKTLPDIVDLDCLPSASIPSTLLCKTITVTKSESQSQSRQKRMPALKHLKLPSTCSSTVLRQTSIPNGYFLSTPEVINELGRLDGHRSNNNNNNGNSSADSPDTHHPLWHTFSPANIFYRLGLHQVLSLSPAPPTSREPPLFPLSHSPPTPTSIPPSSSLSNINAENQNSLITQPVLVSRSSCINMDTVSAYCESESQNSPNVLPKYAKRSKYS